MIWNYQDILKEIGFATKEQHDKWIIETFRCVAKLAFGEKEEYMWWNDSLYGEGIGISAREIDAETAISFMADFVEHHPDAEMSISAIQNDIQVELSINDHCYIVFDDIMNEPNLNIFGMVIWTIAKSFGYKEKLE
tara:strand:- start:2062 stop:2469 length:408 start_codon:yes stop_codon:yes gene_type:complete